MHEGHFSLLRCRANLSAGPLRSFKQRLSFEVVTTTSVEDSSGRSRLLVASPGRWVDCETGRIVAMFRNYDRKTLLRCKFLIPLAIASRAAQLLLTAEKTKGTSDFVRVSGLSGPRQIDGPSRGSHA